MNISSTLIIDKANKTHVYHLDLYQIPTNIKEPTLKVSIEDTPTQYASTIHLKYHNEQYVLHHESEPSLILHHPTIRYAFFVNGVTTQIEDLPCDNEVKLILKLKYSPINDAYVYAYTI
jgi:hypothetical protein